MRFLLNLRLSACSIFVIILGLSSSFAQNAAANKHDLYRMDVASGQIVRDTFLGAQLGGAANLVRRDSANSVLAGVADFDHNGIADTVVSNSSTGTLEVSFYGGRWGATRLRATLLVTPGAGWTARAVADFNGDGQPDILFVNDRTRQAEIYYYGGPQGTTLLTTQTLSSALPADWKVVGAADVNRDGTPDLLLQNASTRQVRVDYVANGAITGSAVLGGSGLAGWSAVGMADINHDGNLHLIYTNDKTGMIMASQYGGASGLTFIKSVYLDSTSSPGWTTVVPTESATLSSGGPGTLVTASPSATTTAATSGTPVLLFVGTGTSSGDVSAVESLLTSLGLGYTAVTSSQLNAMSVSQLLTHRLFIVPGGNAITIGQYLTKTATANVRTAVYDGMHYLGICAGGFFGAYASMYNRLNLTSGVWFDYYADYYKGIHKEAVNLTVPGGAKYDVYWENGPTVKGWGYVVAKYPNGTAAITEGKYGSGLVILGGVHPEAPASWRYGMTFTTSLSADLAFAGNMVKAALAGTYMPHY